MDKYSVMMQGLTNLMNISKEMYAIGKIDEDEYAKRLETVEKNVVTLLKNIEGAN